MFGKQKIPTVFTDLLVEAQATMVRQTPMWNRAGSAYNWMSEHFPNELRGLCQRINARRDEIVEDARKAKESRAAEEEAKKPVPRKVIVPEDKAEEILRLWNAWATKRSTGVHGECLIELYALEKALYAVCPDDMLKWGEGSRYSLDVVHGKVVVTEEME